VKVKHIKNKYYCLFSQFYSLQKPVPTIWYRVFLNT